MNLEYIVSGITFSGSHIYTSDNKDVQEVLSKTMSDLNNKFEDQSFSVLYNAYTEKNLGKGLKNINGYKHLMADSGGLQMVTRGTKINKEIREKIYQNQAEYSDIAMCFDEIPLYVTGDIRNFQSARTNTSKKVFVKELIKPSAIKTAENIKHQLEYFNKVNSKSKVMLIIQGQDIESFREYSETIINYLSDNEIKGLFGIAPSGACSGSGLYTRIDLLYSLKFLEIPAFLKENVHLLGMGSLNGLLPVLSNLDYFSFIKNLSYDSTSHSARFVYGEYINEDNRLIDMGKVKNPYNQSILKNIFKKYSNDFKKFQINNFDEFIEKSTVYSKNNKSGKLLFSQEGCEDSGNASKLFAFFYMVEIITNFMNLINRVREKPEKFINKQNNILGLLKSVKTKEDFLKIRKEFHHFFENEKIKKVNTIADIKSVKNSVVDFM